MVLVVALVTLVIYLGYGRFHRLAFLRKERLLSKVLRLCNKIEILLFESHILHLETYQSSRAYDATCSLCRFFAFLIMTVVLFILMGIAEYCANVIGVIFSAIIIWRSGSFPWVNLISQLENVSSYLTWNIDPLTQELVLPLVKIFGSIGSAQLDLSIVGFTCKGAQGVGELYVNCCILGYLVVHIESDFQVLQYFSFSNLPKKLISEINYYQSKIGFMSCLFAKFCCICCLIFDYFNPFQNALSYIMGFLVFSEFTNKQWALHEVTEACNNFPEFHGFDTFLSFSSSITLWLFVIPGVYTIAKAFIPFGDKKILAFSNNGQRNDPQTKLYSSCCDLSLFNYLKFNYSPDWWTSVAALKSLTVVHEWLDQEEDSKEEPRAAVEIQNKNDLKICGLPSYFELSGQVHKGLRKFFLCGCDENIYNPLYIFIYVFTFILSYSGIGHLFTVNGIDVWKCVVMKYYNFICICFGFWPENAHLFFDFSLYSIGGNAMTQESTSVAHIKLSRLRMTFDKYILNKFPRLISAILGPRTVLLQVFPFTTIISVYSLYTASAPISIASEQLLQKMDPWLNWKAFDVAERQYVIEIGDNATARECGELWILYLKVINIFISKSRCITYVIGLFKFIFSLMILFADHSHSWARWFCLILLILSFTSNLDLIVTIGVFLGVKDKDFCPLIPFSTFFAYIYTMEPSEFFKRNPTGADVQDVELGPLGDEFIYGLKPFRVANPLEHISSDVMLTKDELNLIDRPMRQDRLQFLNERYRYKNQRDQHSSISRSSAVISVNKERAEKLLRKITILSKDLEIGDVSDGFNSTSLPPISNITQDSSLSQMRNNRLQSLRESYKFQRKNSPDSPPQKQEITPAYASTRKTIILGTTNEDVSFSMPRYQRQSPLSPVYGSMKNSPTQMNKVENLTSDVIPIRVKRIITPRVLTSVPEKAFNSVRDIRTVSRTAAFLGVNQEGAVSTAQFRTRIRSQDTVDFLANEINQPISTSPTEPVSKFSARSVSLGAILVVPRNTPNKR